MILSPIQAAEAYLKQTRTWQPLHFHGDQTPAIQVAVAIHLESLVGLGLSGTLYVDDSTDGGDAPERYVANVSIGHIPSVFAAAGMAFQEDTKKHRGKKVEETFPYENLTFPWCMLDANSPTRFALTEHVINTQLPILGFRWVVTKWTKDIRKIEFFGPDDRTIKQLKVGPLLKRS